MPSMFRSFAKKAFSATKSFIKETVDRFKPVQPVKDVGRSSRKYVRPSQQEKIDIGFRKIDAFIARGIRLNPIPKRKKRDRSGVKLCTNHYS